jgi:hypothetical protein
MASGKNQSGLKTLLNCMILFRLKRLFWQNTFIKQYFLSAWTPLPLEKDIAKDGLKIWGLYRAYFGKPSKIWIKGRRRSHMTQGSFLLITIEMHPISGWKKVLNSVL